MGQLIGTILMIFGVFFIFIAGIGLLRMPDLYLRMSASTKAATLGLALILLGTAIYFGELGITSRAIATIIFVFLTAPVSAHMIGRGAYSNGVKLWDGTEVDELNGRYHEGNQTLEGFPIASTREE